MHGMGGWGKVRRYRLRVAGVVLLAVAVTAAGLLLLIGPRLSPEPGRSPHPKAISEVPLIINVLPADTEPLDQAVLSTECAKIPAVANAASVTLGGMSVEITLSGAEGARATDAAIKVTAARPVPLPSFTTCSSAVRTADLTDGLGGSQGSGQTIRLPAPGHSEPLPALDHGVGTDFIMNVLPPKARQHEPVAYTWHVTVVATGLGRQATEKSPTSVLLAAPG